MQPAVIWFINLVEILLIGMFTEQQADVGVDFVTWLVLHWFRLSAIHHGLMFLSMTPNCCTIVPSISKPAICDLWLLCLISTGNEFISGYESYWTWIDQEDQGPFPSTTVCMIVYMFCYDGNAKNKLHQGIAMSIFVMCEIVPVNFVSHWYQIINQLVTFLTSKSIPLQSEKELTEFRIFLSTGFEQTDFFNHLTFNSHLLLWAFECLMLTKRKKKTLRPTWMDWTFCLRACFNIVNAPCVEIMAWVEQVFDWTLEGINNKENKMETAYRFDWLGTVNQSIHQLTNRPTNQLHSLS